MIDRAVVRDLIGERRADPVAQLTRREREILGLMAEGRSNQGICQQLWLSPKTVETHCRSVFAKLGMEGARRGQSPRAGGARLPPPRLGIAVARRPAGLALPFHVVGERPGGGTGPVPGVRR